MHGDKMSRIEKPAEYEGSIATRGSLIDSESVENIDTEKFSQTESGGFTEEAIEQADRAEPRRGIRVKIVPKIFWRSQESPCCDRR